APRFRPATFRRSSRRPCEASGFLPCSCEASSATWSPRKVCGSSSRRSPAPSSWTWAAPRTWWPATRTPLSPRRWSSSATGVAGRRYPLLEGVTHPVIRKAAGLWARRALVLWSEHHRDPRHLLAGETPFVGSRFVELARRRDDGAEALLSARSCRFVIAVPSF